MTPQGTAQLNVSPDSQVIAWCGDTLFACCSVDILLQIEIRNTQDNRHRT